MIPPARYKRLMPQVAVDPRSSAPPDSAVFAAAFDIEGLQWQESVAEQMQQRLSERAAADARARAGKVKLY